MHEFQGAERDEVVLSLGLTGDHPPQRRTFAEDPHLVNVMVTRARRRILVVTALPVGTSGLLGEYLDHAEQPPRPASTRAPRDAWTRALLRELERNGHQVRPGADRRHGVDLVVGEGFGAVGLLTRPHPDGVAADVARHRALLRAGWDVVEVYALPGDDDPVPRVLELRGASRWIAPDGRWRPGECSRPLGAARVLRGAHRRSWRRARGLEPAVASST